MLRFDIRARSGHEFKLRGLAELATNRRLLTQAV